MKKRVMQRISGNHSKESLRLEEGEIYTFLYHEKPDPGSRKTMIKKRMRLLKCYPHHAVFESSKGIRQSYKYWDIEKLLLGEPR